MFCLFRAWCVFIYTVQVWDVVICLCIFVFYMNLKSLYNINSLFLYSRSFLKMTWLAQDFSLTIFFAKLWMEQLQYTFWITDKNVFYVT